MKLTIDTANNNHAYRTPTFGAARLNIASIGDNHGDLLAMPQLMKAIQANRKEIFSQFGEKGVYNMLSIVGDFL